MHRSRPMNLLALLMALGLVLAACSGTTTTTDGDGGDGDGDGSAAPSSETVSLAGGTFEPATLTIPVGTTVTFTDTANHTVTEGTDGVAVDDPFVDEEGGEDIEVTFDEAGTFPITCRIHPAMNMTITVEG